MSNQIEDIIRDLCGQISDNPDMLVERLKSDGFFQAPASVKYHYSFEGGLVRHALNVLNVLKALNTTFCCSYSEQQLIKAALFHEYAKSDMYELYMRNEKQGNQWVQVPSYKVRDDRDVVGDVGLTSYVRLSKLVAEGLVNQLSDDEIAAICNYNHIFNSKEYIDINSIMLRYPLTLLLHLASAGAMYILEKQ